MNLGDVIAEQFDADLPIIHDEHLNAYLDQIADRLLAGMPPTHIKFHVVLIDLPVANAFTLPGGRIYVTRKLVAFTRSEDEIAVVLGHELGHALTHQPAADASRLMREVLGIQQVGDRADIFTKYNQLLENAARKHLHYDRHESETQELVADQYGIYAMSRAGYSPASAAKFWNRLAATEGKTGNWATDFFGITRPNERRLRGMEQYAAEIPAACIANRSALDNSAFRAWRNAVIAYGVSAGTEALPGLLWKRQLSPPLESEINNVRFSPDGKYLLAQDEFSVYVLARQPFHPLFRISVDDIQPAAFTPDSRSIVIWTRSLHVEKWSIASQRRTEVHEVVVRSLCLQSAISPDGNMIACVRADPGAPVRLGLSLIDVSTGTSVVEKKNFYQLSPVEIFAILLADLSNEPRQWFQMNFSPDGHYFAIARGDTALAWDLRARALVKIGTPVKERMSGGFVFVGPNRIVGIDYFDPKRSGIVQFPDGPAGLRIPLRGVNLYAPADGDVVLLRPAGDWAVGLIDLKTGKAALGSHMAALDVYDNEYARPRPDGTVGIYDLKSAKQIAETAMPEHFIGWLRTAALSPDLRWFAGSGSTRGAVWNLTTGGRVFHVRGFESCYFLGGDTLLAEFPSYRKNPRAIAFLDPSQRQIRTGPKIGKYQAAQVGKYLVYRLPEKKKPFGPADLEIRDATTNSVVWTKHFTQGVPEIAASDSADQLSLLSALSSDTAKRAMKQDAALRDEANRIHSKATAQLIQVLNLADGKLLSEFAVDTGHGSFSIRTAAPDGRWVLVTDNYNRILVYSLDGHMEGRIFGTRPIASTAAGKLAFENEPDDVVIYDLGTGTPIEQLRFGSALAHYEFADNGSEFFAVTQDQTAYLLAIHKSKPN
ncbi:MAG TPA: M48 family metalloprotease [Candidatus Acidoferrales bacterium]|nr:M48 family metalloprotease [Candidatus Acidoferrales bacterium]